jgi:imidazolonepropionase
MASPSMLNSKCFASSDSLKLRMTFPSKLLSSEHTPCLCPTKAIELLTLICLSGKCCPKLPRSSWQTILMFSAKKGFFTPEETESICLTGQSYGLQAKIHANQLSNSGGVQAGCKVQALSVDHLESIGETEMNLLAQPSAPIATLLPTAAFFLRMQYAPARELILRNAAIALASDFNPGSSPSGNMNFVVALACIQMRMLPEEAIQAATINGAYAMGIQNIVGSITTGKLANLIFTKPIPSLAYLPYAFTENMIERVMVKGKFMD